MLAESTAAGAASGDGFSTPPVVAIYARVSTSQQSEEPQLAELEHVARVRGWQLLKPYYTDVGFSGALRAESRPGLKAAMQDARRGKFQCLAVWSVDRLGRSTSDLIHTLEELYEEGVEVYAHRQGIDTSTATGRMMWQFLSIFADFERTMIRERVRAGIERARSRAAAQGELFRIGRPSRAARLIKEVLELRSSGLGYVRIGRALGLGTSTVKRICQGELPTDETR